MRPALCLGCTPLKTALIALIKDLTVPSDFVYGYSDSLGEYTGLGVEGCEVVQEWKIWTDQECLQLLTLYSTRVSFLPVMELEITTKPTFSSGISSLYILKLMENSAAVCDNYQPAPEDRVERKRRTGGGGEVSRRRRERLK